MKADESLWALIASAASEVEVEEIARVVGNRIIRDNEVSSCYHYEVILSHY